VPSPLLKIKKRACIGEGCKIKIKRVNTASPCFANAFAGEGWDKNLKFTFAT